MNDAFSFSIRITQLHSSNIDQIYDSDNDNWIEKRSKHLHDSYQ